MSRLPSAGLARVDEVKVRDYLLNPSNPQNNGKAGRFTRFGFTREDWPILLSALAKHAVENDVVAEVASSHGQKYVVRCSLETPDGTKPCLTTVWITELGSAGPRLVTAY